MDKLYARYTSIIPDFEPFMQYLRRPLIQSLRLNTLKAERAEILALLRGIRLHELDFCPDAFVVEGKHSLGNHIAHNLGLIYVQEVASLVPVAMLDPQPGEKVLDLCAAPGSKTTQIGQAMANRGLLVANEVSRKRIRGLIHNVKRCGLINEVVISMSGQKMHRIFTDLFDRVLVDAPCSAEGTVRRSRAVLYHWGVRNIERMARIQIGLAVSGFRALRPGGTMVYSTCTIAPEENEAVVSYLLSKCPDAEILPVALPSFTIRPGIAQWQGETFDPRVRHCGRILPQDNDTAPFFVARLTKKGGGGTGTHRLPSRIESDMRLVTAFADRFGTDTKILARHAVFRQGEENFVATQEAYSFQEAKVIRRGLEFGRLYGHDLKPDNDTVQLFGRGAVRNVAEMDEQQAVRFLRGETVTVGQIDDTIKGFVIVRFNGLTLGVGRYNGMEIKSAIKRERRTL